MHVHACRSALASGDDRTPANAANSMSSLQPPDAPPAPRVKFVFSLSGSAAGPKSATATPLAAAAKAPRMFPGGRDADDALALGEKPTCPGKHGLAKGARNPRYNPKGGNGKRGAGFAAGSHGWTCDGCKVGFRKFLDGDAAHGCRECDYDLCARCYCADPVVLAEGAGRFSNLNGSTGPSRDGYMAATYTPKERDEGEIAYLGVVMNGAPSLAGAQSSIAWMKEQQDLAEARRAAEAGALQADMDIDGMLEKPSQFVPPPPQCPPPPGHPDHHGAGAGRGAGTGDTTHNYDNNHAGGRHVARGNVYRTLAAAQHAVRQAQAAQARAQAHAQALHAHAQAQAQA